MLYENCLKTVIQLTEGGEIGLPGPPAPIPARVRSPEQEPVIILGLRTVAETVAGNCMK